MTKYKNKYRSESARATWWNYGWAGAYFITICTKNRKPYFGGIILGESNEMILSNCGVLADVFWHEIPHHAKNVELGAFVVMPNHIHGILILSSDSDESESQVRTGHALSQRALSQRALSQISPQSPELSESKKKSEVKEKTQFPLSSNPINRP